MGHGVEPELGVPAVVFLTVCYVLINMTLLRWAHEFRQRKLEFGIAGRKHHLIWAFFVCSEIWFHTRLIAVYLRLSNKDKAKELNEAGKACITIYYFFTVTSFVLAATALSLRVWLLYFDSSLAAENSESQWTALITLPVSFQPEILFNSDMIEISGSNTLVRRDRSAVVSRFLPGPPNMKLMRDRSKRTRSSLGRGSSFFSTVNSVHSTKELNNSRTVSSTTSLTDLMQGINEESSWFFQNKSTFGNYRWLQWRIAWMLPVIILLSMLPWILEKELKTSNLWFLSQLSYTLAPLMFASFLGLIWKYFPKFNDNLKFVSELNLLIIAASVTTLLGSILVVISIFEGKKNNGEDHEIENNLIYSVFSNLLLMICTMWIWLIQTKFICMSFVKDEITDEVILTDVPIIQVFFPFAYRCDNQMWKYLDFHRRPNVDTNDDESIDSRLLAGNFNTHDSLKYHMPAAPESDRRVSKHDKSAVKCKPKITVKDVLRDESAFRAFMKHLFAEFSYESLLCIVELAQFGDRFGDDPDQSSDHHSGVVHHKPESERNSGLLSYSSLLTSNILSPTFGPQSEGPPSSARSSPGFGSRTVTLKKAANYFTYSKSQPNSPDISPLAADQSRDLEQSDTFRSTSRLFSAFLDRIPGRVLQAGQPSTEDENKDEEDNKLDSIDQHESTPETVELNGSKQRCSVLLPQSVRRVKSSIVWHNSMSKEQIYCVLCQKYISNDGEMSVNISHQTRAKLMDVSEFLLRGTLPRIVDNEEEMAVIKEEMTVTPDIFDSVIFELMQLMRDSFERFRRNREYREFERKKQVMSEKRRSKKLSFFGNNNNNNNHNHGNLNSTTSNSKRSNTERSELQRILEWDLKI